MPDSFEYVVAPGEALTLTFVRCGTVTLAVPPRSPALSIATNEPAQAPWCSKTSGVPCARDSTGNFTGVVIVGSLVDSVLGTVFFVSGVPIKLTVSTRVTPVPDAEIPPWVQAYGRGVDANCLDGWGPSWQHWALPFTGGWVCSRTIPSLG